MAPRAARSRATTKASAIQSSSSKKSQLASQSPYVSQYQSNVQLPNAYISVPDLLLVMETLELRRLAM
jgi:hypothetical protein